MSAYIVALGIYMKGRGVGIQFNILSMQYWNAYGRHHDLVNRYGVSVLQMTTDMFHFS
jgi:hypothetical protein